MAMTSLPEPVLIEPHENAQPSMGQARVQGRSANTRGVTQVLLDNMATVLSAAAAFLVFVGNGYFGELFKHFGLQQSILAISQIEMGTMGLYASIYAIPKLIYDNLFALMVSSLIPILSLGLWFITRKTAFGRMVRRTGDRILRFHDRHQVWFLKWPTIVFFGAAGMLAGSLGGKHDAQYFEQERLRSNRCFAIGDKMYRSVVLAQDQNRTVLLHRDRLSLVKNDNISYVRPCPNLKVAT